MFAEELDQAANLLKENCTKNRRKSVPIEDDSENSDGSKPTESEPPEPISWTSGR